MFLTLDNPFEFIDLTKITNPDLLHLAMIQTLNDLEINNKNIPENQKIIGNLKFKDDQNDLIRFYQLLFLVHDPKEDSKNYEYSINIKYIE